MSRLRSAALTTALLVLAIGCGLRSAPIGRVQAVETADLEALFEAMGQRLALMPQVAEWKRARDRPVRDRLRELVVLEQAVSAVQRAAQQTGRASFSADAVRRFYQAQIDTAVEIQERILEKPPQPGAETADLETAIRPALDRLGNRIAVLLVIQRRAPHRALGQQLARRHWQLEGFDPKVAERLLRALERLLESRPAR